MPELVVRYRLQDELCVLDRRVLFRSDLDAFEVELRLVGGGAGPLLPKECMRRAVRHVLKVFEMSFE